MSNEYGVLEWTNENSNSSYPLASPFILNDFIVDAVFHQFDGFIPILKTVTVAQQVATLVITTDAGDVTVEVQKPGVVYSPDYWVEIFEPGTPLRSLGYLVFGQGLVQLFATYFNTTLRPGIPFLASVVRSVNSAAGVYSVQARVRSLELDTGATKVTQSIFFDVNTDTSTVTWNAGTLTPVVTTIGTVPLKTLNGVAPLNNAVFIEDSSLIKVTPQSNSVLIELAVPVTHDVISPVLKYE